MQRSAFLFLGALFLAVVGCGGSDDSGHSGSAGTVLGAYENGHPITMKTVSSSTLQLESEVVRIVNEHRVALGMNALVARPSIADVARGHSVHMTVHNFFAHENPEGDTPGARISKGGVAWSMAGENLAAGYSTPESAFVAWMNSPGHKENIEREGWVFTGVGYWHDSEAPYQYYWTQNFSKP